MSPLRILAGELNVGYFESKKLELQELLLLLNKQKSALETSINYIKRSDGERGLLSFEEQMEAAKEAMKHITQERKIGVPWLAKAYDDYFELQERGILSHLQKKSQPAIKAAEIVREYSRLRRDAERRARIAESLLAYYEYVAPFLVDLKEEAEDLDATDSAIPQDFSEEELADEVTGFLTKDEYHNLSVSERNQLALDRYWSRPKSKSTIGRMYERYIGYIFECQGYSVEYHGIFEGFADLGRDLICETEAEAVLIQCKNWSHFRRIHEKHIFQFFGTVFEYRDSHPARKVRALFYTSTEVSGPRQAILSAVRHRAI